MRKQQKEDKNEKMLKHNRKCIAAVAMTVITAVCYVLSRAAYQEGILNLATTSTIGTAFLVTSDSGQDATKGRVYGGMGAAKLRNFNATTDGAVADRPEVRNRLSDSAATTMSERNDVEESLSFDQVWPSLQGKLCPGMVPNATTFGPVLFELARDELGMAKLTIEKRGPRREHLFSRFFHGKAYVGFTYVSPNNESTSYLSIWKAGHNQIRLGSKELFMGKGGSFLDRGMTTQIDRIQPGTCIVTATRDPVSHFLSGYNEEEYRCQMNELKCPHPKDKLFYQRYAVGTKQRFRQFVADFLIGQKSVGVNATFAHVYSTTAWLSGLSKIGARLTSYLPTVENLSQAWPKFLHDTCPGIPENFASDTLPLAGKHASQVDAYGFYEAAKEVWAEEGPTARALCALHAIDYACYEDLPEIPNICKSVFANQHFLETIRRKAEA